MTCSNTCAYPNNGRYSFQYLKLAVFLFWSISFVHSAYSQCDVAPFIYPNGSACNSTGNGFIGELYSEGFQGTIFFEWYKNGTFEFSTSEYGNGNEISFKSYYTRTVVNGDQLEVRVSYQSCTAVSSGQFTVSSTNVFAGGSGISCAGTATFTINATSGATLTVYKVVNGSTNYLSAVNGVYSDPNYTYASHYYVYASISGCTSNATEMLVEDYTPPMPDVSPANPTVCQGGSVTLTASASGYAADKIHWYNSSGGHLASGSQYAASGNVYVSVIDGCEGPRRYVSVTTTILPAPTVNPSAPVICNGESVTLTASASGYSTFIWYDSNGNVISGNSTNQITTTSSVSVAISGGGCVSEKKVVPVTISGTKPVFPPVAEDVSRCGAGEITLRASGTFTSYKWFNANGAELAGKNTSEITVNVNNSTTFQVSGLNGNCESDRSGPIHVNLRYAEFGCENYVVVTDIEDKATSPSGIEALSSDLKQTKITYIDGLGRTMQEVLTKASPDKKDIVQPFVYDAFGREKTKYLPYVSSESNGLYKENVIGVPGNYNGSVHHDFYNSTPKIASDQKPFAVTVFEPSPLNRVIKQGAPGAVWQPVDESELSINDYTSKKRYRLNEAGEVYFFIYNMHNGALSLASNKYYMPRSISALQSLDESNNQIIEFVDKEGRTVCKKVQLTGTAEAAQFAATYYIYDDFGNLAVVLQPEGTKTITSATTAVPSQTLERWAFQYKYDARKRMTHKKVPGADWVYMVYDVRDRLAMTQDGEQRKENRWSFTKYDVLNRAVMTGIYSHNNKVDQAWMAARIDTTKRYELFDGNSANHGYTNVVFPTASAEVLTITYYDNYTFRTLIPGNEFYYKKNEIANQYQNPDPAVTVAFNRVTGQVTGTRIKVLGENKYLWQVNYYDDRYRLVQAVASNNKSGIDRVTNLYDFPGKILETKMTHTAPAVPAVGTAGVSVSRKLSYDHAGRLLETRHRVKDQPEMVLSANEYNALGQLVTKKLHSKGQATPYVTADPAVGQPGVVYGSEINSSNYNSAQHTYIATKRIRLQPGFLVSANTFKGRIGYSQQDADAYNRQLDAEAGFRQLIDYRYNIRGWLTRINNSDLSVIEGGPRDYFGMELYYNETSTGLSGYQPQFNGNISAMKWSTNLGLGITAPELELDEPRENAYTFSYDTLNRLKSASFHAKASAWNASTAFHENGLKYDLNGNIQALNRTTDGGVPMDQLSYTYAGNQLQKVSDASGNAKGFSDGSNSGVDYAYDANGNLIVDGNKGIDTITYNYLNLPDTVRKNSGDYIKYTYDATGRKLCQEVYDAADTRKKKTDYAGEFFYENDTLKFVNHEEGRVVMTGTVPEYQYHLKDHLGNVRVSFTTIRAVDTYNATLESSHITQERADFPNYNDMFISTASAYNHTVEANATRSVALNGAEGKQVGLAKSLRIVPGDTIDMKVYAKYFVPNQSGQPAVGTSIISAITSAFGLSANSTGPEHSAFESLSEIFEAGWFIGPGDWEDDNAPKAYLNYILFDENFVPYDMGWDQIDAHANGTSPHDTLQLQAVARKPGYAYIYFSNEDDQIIEVYFDDLDIEHVHSPVVQGDDYYPFGLRFNSYSSETSLEQNYLYTGKELQSELGLGWLDFGARMYIPEIGRWGVNDLHAEKYDMVSPLNYVFNNPINAIDPDGRDAIFTVTRNEKGEITGVRVSATVYIQGAGASQERADELNSNSANVFKSKTIKGNVKVDLDIQYKYAEQGITTKDLKGGENILTFIDRVSTPKDRSHVSGFKNKDTDQPRTGRVGLIYKDDWNSDNTIFHESLHFTGLPDKYYEPYPGETTPMEGFENDIMGNSSVPRIGYDHYDSYYLRAREVYDVPGNKVKFSKGFINRKKLSSRPVSQEQIKGK